MSNELMKSKCSNSSDEGLQEDFNQPMVEPAQIILNGIRLDQVNQFECFANKRRPSNGSGLLSVNNGFINSFSPYIKPSYEDVSHFGHESGQLFISNLHPIVTDVDLKTIFSTFGPLIRSGNNYNNKGRSTGTALIVFKSLDDASLAYQSLIGQSLKGQPISLNLIQSVEHNFNSRIIGTKVLKESKNRIMEVKETARTAKVCHHIWSNKAKKIDGQYYDNYDDENKSIKPLKTNYS